MRNDNIILRGHDLDAVGIAFYSQKDISLQRHGFKLWLMLLIKPALVIYLRRLADSTHSLVFNKATRLTRPELGVGTFLLE